MAVAPHMHSAPEPALPAVRVVLRVGESQQVDEAEVGAESVSDVTPHVMRACRGQHAGWAHLTLHFDDLVGDEVQSLVPADGHIARDASVLAVALALGVEVGALERSEDAFGRVDGRLVRHGPRGIGCLSWRREPAAPRLDAPGLGVGVVQFDGGNTQDLAVFDIDEYWPTGRAVGQSLDLSHGGDAPFNHESLPVWSNRG